MESIFSIGAKVSLYYILSWFIYFCLHDDDDYEYSTNVSIGEKITKDFIFADFLNAFIALR